MTFSSWIKAKMKKAKRTQAHLGEVLGVHQTAVCRIIQGTQKLEIAQAFQLAKSLKVKPIELMKVYLSKNENEKRG